MGQLKRAHASAFLFKTSRYKLMNKSRPLGYPKYGSMGRVTRWKAKSIRQSDHNASRSDLCQVRILPLIWKRTLLSEDNYNFNDSSTLTVKSTTHTFYEISKRISTRESSEKIIISGDSTLIITQSSHSYDSYMNYNGSTILTPAIDVQHDTVLTVLDALGLPVYIRHTSGQDSLSMLEITVITYDHNERTSNYRRSKSWHSLDELTTTRNCSCDEYWRPIRCSVSGMDDKILTTSYKYDSAGIVRRVTVRQGKKVTEREVFRFRRYRQ